jgi:hypothetical protein
MNSDGGLDTLEVHQRHPPRPAPPMRALLVGFPRLLPIPHAILLRCIGVSGYASGASDERVYDDHDCMHCR